MTRLELTRRLARESHQSSARAADRVDGWIHKLLLDIREGNAVPQRVAGASERDGRPEKDSR